jgi:hypothetical protein
MENKSVPDTIYEAALVNFIRFVSERKATDMAKNYPSLRPYRYYYTRGSRYDRVVQDDGCQRSVYCFIDRATGDILKGSWKQPVAPKVARGNIYNADPLAGTTVYGPKYLR